MTGISAAACATAEQGRACTALLNRSYLVGIPSAAYAPSGEPQGAETTPSVSGALVTAAELMLQSRAMLKPWRGCMPHCSCSRFWLPHAAMLVHLWHQSLTPGLLGCRPMLHLMALPWMCAWRSMRMWLVAMRSSPLFRQETDLADSQWARSTRPTCGRSVRAGRQLLVHVIGHLPAVLDVEVSGSDEL